MRAPCTHDESDSSGSSCDCWKIKFAKTTNQEHNKSIQTRQILISWMKHKISRVQRVILTNNATFVWKISDCDEKHFRKFQECEQDVDKLIPLSLQWAGLEWPAGWIYLLAIAFEAAGKGVFPRVRPKLHGTHWLYSYLHRKMGRATGESVCVSKKFARILIFACARIKMKWS